MVQLLSAQQLFDEMLVHEGPARVFDCEEDAIAAIKGGKIVDLVMLLLSDMKALRVVLV